MKKILLLTACLLVGFTILGQTRATGALTIHVKDIEDGAFGPLVILLYEQKNGFPKAEEKATYKAVVKKYMLEASHTFEDLPYGNYAVVAYVDENQNGEMDTNFIGVPQEPTAISNMDKLVRPNFRKAIIRLKRAEQEITLGLLH